MNKRNWLGALSFFVLANSGNAQVTEALGQIHGNFQVDAQYYYPDSLIGAPKVSEKMLSNGFANLNYAKGDFSAGLRYESYQNVMLGYDERYKGQGVTYRFARYKHKDIDFTIGSFYEQFGSGMILRAWDDRTLLFDTYIDGFRVNFNPYKGFRVKSLIGKQRVFFGLSNGIVRGVDGEINLNEMFDSLMVNCKTNITFGGSFVSKYQQDKDPTLILPENVGCYGGRMNITRGGFSWFSEYAYKINDPSLSNRDSYKPGEGLFTSASYATSGFSVLLQGKYIDNMSYRSERGQTFSAAMINYLPPVSKNHTYLLMTFYPYASQPNGEISYAGEIQYKAKKGSFIGGETGLEMALNYSAAYGTDTTLLDPTVDDQRLKYSINKTSLGDKYFEDLNLDIIKKLSKKVKLTLTNGIQFYNDNIIRHSNANAGYANIQSIINVVDVTYKYKSGASIRFEAEHLTTTQDKGSWAYGMVEWNPNDKFYMAVSDNFNYGNKIENNKVHYYLLNLGYNTGPTRIAFGYGKQRAGIFCVGGVCRNVPASNGFTFSVSSSF